MNGIQIKKGILTQNWGSKDVIIYENDEQITMRINHRNKTVAQEITLPNNLFEWLCRDITEFARHKGLCIFPTLFIENYKGYKIDLHNTDGLFTFMAYKTGAEIIHNETLQVLKHKIDELNSTTTEGI